MPSRIIVPNGIILIGLLLLASVSFAQAHKPAFFSMHYSSQSSEPATVGEEYNGTVKVYDGSFDRPTYVDWLLDYSQKKFGILMPIAKTEQEAPSNSTFKVNTLVASVDTGRALYVAYYPLTGYAAWGDFDTFGTKGYRAYADCMGKYGKIIYDEEQVLAVRKSDTAWDIDLKSAKGNYTLHLTIPKYHGMLHHNGSSAVINPATRFLTVWQNGKVIASGVAHRVFQQGVAVWAVAYSPIITNSDSYHYYNAVRLTEYQNSSADDFQGQTAELNYTNTTHEQWMRLYPEAHSYALTDVTYSYEQKKALSTPLGTLKVNAPQSLRRPFFLSSYGVISTPTGKPLRVGIAMPFRAKHREDDMFDEFSPYIAQRYATVTGEEGLPMSVWFIPSGSSYSGVATWASTTGDTSKPITFGTVSTNTHWNDDYFLEVMVQAYHLDSPYRMYKFVIETKYPNTYEDPNAVETANAVPVRVLVGNDKYEFTQIGNGLAFPCRSGDKGWILAFGDRPESMTISDLWADDKGNLSGSSASLKEPDPLSVVWKRN